MALNWPLKTVHLFNQEREKKKSQTIAKKLSFDFDETATKKKKKAMTKRKRTKVSYLWHRLFLMFSELHFLQHDNSLFLAFDFLQLKEKKKRKTPTTNNQITVQFVFVNEREKKLYVFSKFHFCIDRSCHAANTMQFSYQLHRPNQISHSRLKTITDLFEQNGLNALIIQCKNNPVCFVALD